MTSKKDVADAIWEDIQNKPIEMFALPNQTIKDHVVKLSVPGADQLYVKLTSGAVLESLEASIGKLYDIETAEKYVIIRNKTPEIKIVEENTDE